MEVSTGNRRRRDGSVRSAAGGTVEQVTRYTPPQEPDDRLPLRRRSRSVRIGVWVVLVGVVSLVFVDVLAALL